MKVTIGNLTFEGSVEEIDHAVREYGQQPLVFSSAVAEPDSRLIIRRTRQEQVQTPPCPRYDDNRTTTSQATGFYRHPVENVGITGCPT